MGYNYYRRFGWESYGLLTFLVVLVAIFAVWELKNRTMLPALTRAEQWCEEEPARAFATLDSIPPRWWWHPERRARHSLIYSKTLDKSYVDLKSDSLISRAVDYYGTFGPDRYMSMSLYYAGRVYQNAGKLSQAYAYFSAADSLAGEIGELHLGGLASRALSEIFNYANDFESQLRYALKAYDLFTQAGSTSHADYMHYNIGNALYVNKRYQEAAESYQRGIETSVKNNDTLSLPFCYKGLATTYLQLGDFSQAKRLLAKTHYAYGYPQDVQWLVDYAVVCAIEGKIDSALYFLGKADRISQNIIEYAEVVLRKSYIDALRIRQLRGASKTEPRLRSEDSLLRNIYDTPIKSDSLKNYILKAQVLSLQLKNRTNAYVCFIGVLAILLVAMMVWLRHRKRQHLKKEMDYMLQIEEIRKILFVKEEEITAMGENLQIGFKERFQMLNQFFEIYHQLQSIGSTQEGANTPRQIRNIIAEIASPRYASEVLEPLINRNYNRAMARMREQLTDIKEEEMRLFCYLVCGFSYQTISLFMELNDGVLRKRIFQLREKIKKSGAPENEEFYQMIAAKKGRAKSLKS